ncbi:efflux transporter, RND family, MFP subunit [alpha proteobacterium BAL199]|jgi:membrane fusion protein, multidrug efflux system|nr:efflux transporter, RND family, MFP subunit [alpha proteobacterium BAL199]
MRVNPSIVLATVIALGAVGWILSGQVSDRPATAASEAADDTAKQPAPTRVRIIVSRAADYRAVIRASGQTMAARSIEIRAETDGRVAKIGPARGARVAAGDVILQLDEADRQAQLERAKARVEQRRIEYDAARKLAASGYQAETKRAEALAEYQDARAEEARIRVDIERTRIVAPFDAVLDKRPMEVGDYLKVGDIAATLVELDPLRAVVYVPEQQMQALADGMTATARLASGEERAAIISYTASVAETATRTFKVEAEFANPNGRIGEGMTTELLIPLPTVRAHHVSPAAFLLDDQGKIGVMTVDSGNVARFGRIRVIGSDGAGAWVVGLAETAQVITVGQQLVKDGDLVTPVEASAKAPQS